MSSHVSQPFYLPRSHPLVVDLFTRNPRPPCFAMDAPNPLLPPLYRSPTPLHFAPHPARTCSQQLLRSTEASSSLACLCSRRVRSEPELVLGIPHTRTCAAPASPPAHPPSIPAPPPVFCCTGSRCLTVPRCHGRDELLPELVLEPLLMPFPGPSCSSPQARVHCLQFPHARRRFLTPTAVVCACPRRRLSPCSHGQARPVVECSKEPGSSLYQE